MMVRANGSEVTGGEGKIVLRASRKSPQMIGIGRAEWIWDEVLF